MSRSMSFVALAVAVVTTGCSGADEVSQSDRVDEQRAAEEMPADVRSVVASSNTFALELFDVIREEEGNIFLSPYSIATALAMTYAGAAGSTATEMAEVLRIQLSAEDAHPAFGDLVESLDRGSESGNYELSVANALWPQTGYTFLESYLSIPKDHYDAMLEELDYAGATEAARLRINAWVEEKTKEKIKGLLHEGDLDAATSLVLTNAIYFKGFWASQFNPEHTRTRPFTLIGGTEVLVPMMYQKAPFKYASLEQLKVLEMPYQGDDLSMIILLPDETDGIGKLEGQLSDESLARWTGAMREIRLEVMFPKFSMSSRFDLSEVLSGMGMPSAFTPGADFSKMTGARGLYIDKVIHQAFVDVDEKGTEAAAATAVIMTKSASINRFVANHPFLLLIRDNVTGSILFMGRVTDPTA